MLGIAHTGTLYRHNSDLRVRSGECSCGDDIDCSDGSRGRGNDSFWLFVKKDGAVVKQYVVMKWCTG